ncbi:MAG: cell envelope integrity protein CreD [Ferruginibacter sp.]
MMETDQPTSFWQRNKLIIKAFFIGFLILVLLIPTLFIMSLVSDREHRRSEVVNEVSSKWANAQTVTGPFLTVPYYVEEKENDNKSTLRKKLLYILPEELNVNGKLFPQLRHRSIFNVPVYSSSLQLSGKFKIPKPEKLPVGIAALRFDEASICMGISDFKGIGESLQLKWNDTTLDFETGVPDIDWLKDGVSSQLKLKPEDLTAGTSTFNVNLSLKGSESLYVTPFGNSTKVRLESSWNNPAFDGKYLPDTNTVADSGFTAEWKIMQFNRSYPQYFTSYNEYNISESGFGVRLLQPVDSYAQTMRSVKYAVLIIALTFFVYFFLEIFYRRSVHALQYILIGFALVIFYTLLLSISEYLAFGQAYLIAAIATVVLIGWYTMGIFKKWSIVFLFSLILSMLYLFIYVLIQLQDNALLFGSIGLFILLAIIMYFSRRINWNNDGKKIETTSSAHHLNDAKHE